MERNIEDLLLHFKFRPTYAVLDTIYVTLTGRGYEVPKWHSTNVYNDQDIDNYINEIKSLLSTGQSEPNGPLGPLGPNGPVAEKSTKEVFTFEEAKMLPSNVFVADGDVDDNYVENYETCRGSESESESDRESVNSDLEEEGYDYGADNYDNDNDDNDSGEFSD